MFDTKDMSINQRVKFYRKMRDLRQEDVAKEIGMETNAYSQMERDGKITAERLLKIADALGIPAQRLFLGETEGEEPFQIPQPENGGLLKQPIETPAPFKNAYSSEEEQAFEVIHNLKQKNKKRVFEFVNQIYKEERGE